MHDAPAKYTRYGEAEVYGSQWQNWLDDPTDMSCKVPRSTLAVQDLQNNGWKVQHDGWTSGGERIRMNPPPRSVCNMAASVGLPIDPCYKDVSVQKRVQLESGGEYYHNEYLMRIGPGVIFSLFSNRMNGPHWSEIALAVYRHYETEELRYVFRVDVVNHAAVDFVTKHLYTLQNDLTWPDYEAKVWEPGSSEYRALLSTPPVRGVAALVLGGYERDTKHIAGVATWVDRKKNLLQMLVVLQSCK